MSLLSLFSIPNLLTLFNLFMGCVAVVFIFNYQMELVPYCVLASLIADFLDGFAARAFKSASDIGKQLDSLADVVSFGLVPGAIMFNLLFDKYETGYSFFSSTKMYILSAPAFILTLFAALRLAKFNVDTRQTNSFLGLPTPAMTIFIVGYLLIIQHDPLGLADVLYKRPLMYGLILFIAPMMLIELPMFALKFKSFGWKGNEVVYLFLLVCLILLVTLKFAAVSLIILLYILISIALKFIKT